MFEHTDRSTVDRLPRRQALIALAALAGCAAPPEVEQKAFKPPVFPAPPEQPRFYWERTIRSTGDIIQDETSDFRRMITGESQAGEGLAKPYAVAVFRGRIFVSDTVTRFVRLFDVPAGKYARIGDDDGQGQLNKPIGLDVDGKGNLYVADIGAGAIQVYGPDGTWLRKIGGPTWFQRLTSVTVDPMGNRLYGVDIGGVTSDQHMVRVFDGQTGAHVMDIGKRGSGPGQFNLPRDLAIGIEGRLYVVDGGNFRVVVFDKDGKFLKSFGSVGKQYGQFARPKEIATDRDGNVYVVDTAFGNFQIFNPEGELLLFVGDRSERDGPAKYMLPSGISVDEDGRVYVVDQWFRKLEVYRPASLAANTGFLARRVAAKKP